MATDVELSPNETAPLNDTAEPSMMSTFLMSNGSLDTELFLATYLGPRRQPPEKLYPLTVVLLGKCRLFLRGGEIGYGIKLGEKYWRGRMRRHGPRGGWIWNSNLGKLLLCPSSSFGAQVRPSNSVFLSLSLSLSLSYLSFSIFASLFSISSFP